MIRREARFAKVAFAAAMVGALAAVPQRALAEDAKETTPKDQAAEEAVSARAFAVRFRPLTDAAEIVGSILSDRGEITLQPRFKQLVVRDRVSILDQIEPLIESFDLPPRSVEVSISLALGAQAEAGRTAPDELYPRDRGIWEMAPITGFTAFDPLGKRSIIGVEGATVTTDLSEDYRVVFEVEWVEDDRVNFKSFALQRITRTPEGEEQVRSVYSAEINLQAGKPLLVGAAQAPNSKKALFLKLEAVPR